MNWFDFMLFLTVLIFFFFVGGMLYLERQDSKREKGLDDYIYEPFGRDFKNYRRREKKW